ncbi:RNA polymerase recycling motor HelD [Fonticella tunisiensis]|uniref:DNA 3'-5' helicase n=1 Tax=Fonticella tunisiensis TaxID=1096341 RepID=A0A4R7KXD8_9CLOT|nr:RNA polymerase recycling motor HelD [Fonticella tunisiensis]TDT63680.1 DNA helicase-2/ATP-dependent DNA helicase PcrA [Fonticella tunisiensis]
MSISNHPDYSEELQRLNFTLDYLKKYHSYILKEKERIDREVDYNTKHFSSDNSQQYIDLMINTTFQSSISQRLVNIEKAHSKPYFARVDFTEDKTGKYEKIYIGKLSLMSEDQKELIIVDWRAPIANLYYEGRLGEANYICPEGKIDGQINLKRQHTIEEGILKEFFDIDITTNDEFLQAYLGANADSRLKDIVSTIQVEQNRIIRADMWKPLIVQGAAGGGKTTIALHRIAYLIYTYEKSFKPENFMIIAPNRLFLNYISEVLPELGVDRVKQITFEDFASELLEMRFNLKDPNEKLSAIINSRQTDEDIKRKHLMMKASRFKSSLDFKKLIDDYMRIVEDELIPQEDFKIEDFVLLTYDEIRRLFLKEYKDLPMMKRVNEIKKHLNNRLKLKKDSILSKLQQDCDRRIMSLKLEMPDSEERHRLIVEAIDTKNKHITNINSYSKKAVKEYISKISPLKPLEYYKRLMTTELFDKLAEKYIDKELIAFIKSNQLELFNSKLLEIEDLAPLTAIKYLVYGLNEKIQVKHIVIDEAQDFSLYQLYLLKQIIKDSSFTILGDLSQGIHSYRGTKDWNEVGELVFGNNCRLLFLEQSYRTTVEIMEAANKVIKSLEDPNLIPAKPVIRHGEKVELIIKNDMNEIARDIKEKLDKLEEMGYKSAAVICKTMDECIELRTMLKGLGKDIPIISGNEKEYKGGIIIVPSYLSKGLEFDLVIIANASKKTYTNSELDVKLLYVAMTRPLHRLYIYSAGEPLELLKNI